MMIELFMMLHYYVLLEIFWFNSIYWFTFAICIFIYFFQVRFIEFTRSVWLIFITFSQFRLFWTTLTFIDYFSNLIWILFGYILKLKHLSFKLLRLCCLSSSWSNSRTQNKIVIILKLQRFVYASYHIFLRS